VDPAELVDWFTAPEQWSGSTAIPKRMFEHIVYSVPPVVAALIPGILLGLYVGHRRRYEFLITTASLSRALPSFAILALTFPIALRFQLGFDFWPTFAALFLLAIPPIVTNTYVGVREVDRDAVEAARGMGMTESEVLRQIELPLAAPVIVAGIRTAAVQVVATATLAALVAGGGLGRYIVDGLATSNEVRVVGGAILVALLAIVTELLFAVVERWARPKTTRAEPRRARPFRYLGQTPQPPIGPIG
jgi:osmoprotectant transport system permease protein